MNPQSVKNLLWAAVLAAATAVAPAHAEGMGYVDARRLIEQAPQGQQQIRELEAEFAERNRELQVSFQLFKDQEEDLEKNRLVMTEEELADRIEDLRALERQLQRAQREYNEDYARRRNQRLNKLDKQITEVIVEVAKRENLDVVFRQAVYASPEIDLTDQVLEELKERYQQ